MCFSLTNHFSFLCLATTTVYCSLSFNFRCSLKYDLSYLLICSLKILLSLMWQDWKIVPNIQSVHFSLLNLTRRQSALANIKFNYQWIPKDTSTGITKTIHNRARHGRSSVAFLRSSDILHALKVYITAASNISPNVMCNERKYASWHLILRLYSQ